MSSTSRALRCCSVAVSSPDMHFSSSGTLRRAFTSEECKRSSFNALARSRSGWRARIIKCRMGSPPSQAIFKRFVGLEDQCLIAPHAGKPIPAVFAVVLYGIRLPDAVRITAFGYNEIIGRDAARIANGERERLDGMANGTPHLHNG